MTAARRRSDGTTEVRGLYPCPSCGKPDHVEANVEKRLWKCWSCGRGGVVEEGVDLGNPQTMKRVRRWKPIQKKLPLPAVKEIERRGLCPEWVEVRYRVHWNGERMAWPAGEGWSLRALNPLEEPKTLTVAPRGLIGQHLLDVGQDLVITEGDYKAAAVPLPWVGIGVMGIWMTAAQAAVIRQARPRTITMLLDGGKEAEAEQMAVRLICSGARLRRVSLPEGKGPDDIPRGELVSLLLEGGVL